MKKGTGVVALAGWRATATGWSL